MLVAILCVCGWLTVPVGDVALTMQTFGVFLTLRLLGGKRGTATIGAYLLLGAVGLPVFSGFRGGLGMLLGSTGGYLLGFLVTGLIYWVVEGLFCQRGDIAGMILGLLGCYVFGSGWYLLIYAENSALIAIIVKCVAPFLIPDLLKLFLAMSLGKRIRKYNI
jgi:biotin transport system substrate-specific component